MECSTSLKLVGIKCDDYLPETLYFTLSSTPSREWAQEFRRVWDKDIRYPIRKKVFVIGCFLKLIEKDWPENLELIDIHKQHIEKCIDQTNSFFEQSGVNTVSKRSAQSDFDHRQRVEMAKQILRKYDQEVFGNE